MNRNDHRTARDIKRWGPVAMLGAEARESANDEPEWQLPSADAVERRKAQGDDLTRSLDERRGQR